MQWPERVWHPTACSGWTRLGKGSIGANGVVLEPNHTIIKQLVIHHILQLYTNSTVKHNSKRRPTEVIHFYTAKNIKFAQINFHTDHIRLHLNSHDKPEHINHNDPQFLTKIIKALHNRPEGPFVNKRKHR